MIAVTSVGEPLYVGLQPLRLDGGFTEPVVPVTPGGAIPATNLVGWWDASTMVPSAVSVISSIPAAGATTKVATTSPAVKVMPRQAGVLPGLFAETSANNYVARQPVMNDSTINVSSLTVGAGQLLTLFLVWSRPNLRQPNQGAFSNADVPLIAVGGTLVLSLTSVGDGTDTLKLFPAATPVSGGTLSIRHTHSARVVFNGATVDVWLDGTKVISGAANQMTLGATANLSFLGASQLIFHEAAAWNVALAADKHAELTSYATRWPLGTRYAVNGIVLGQSNMDLILQYSVNITFNKSLAYWTGGLSVNLLSALDRIAAGKTTFSGQGLYSSGTNLFLDGSTGAANVTSWPLGTNGLAYMAAIDALTADQKANLRFVFWFWSESIGSALVYSDKGTCIGAVKRAIGFIRARAGKTAAQLPIMFIDSLPFSTAVGCQTYREAIQDIVNDAAMNCHFMLTQTDDAIGQGDTWDSVTGLESGSGNNAHRDVTGLHSFARRCAIPTARAVIAANAAHGTPDAITTIDASVPSSCGPRITAASYEGTAYAATGSVLVTVAHNGGTDLSLPLRAAMGVGWTLMDGVSASVAGTPGTPGALIAATACARVSTTQLRVTLASLPANPGKAQIYYVYGTGLDASNYAVIGQGNAVIDNFASVTLAAGWRIGTDMGAAAQPNHPLQATTYGVALT